MAETSVFNSNGIQVIRLPKPVAFPDYVKKVEIIVLGRSRLVVPAEESWDAWFDGEGVSADFMREHDQPQVQRRDSF